MAKGKNVNTDKKMVNKDHMGVFGGIKGKDRRSICTDCTADTYDERIRTEDPGGNRTDHKYCKPVKRYGRKSRK